MPTEGEFEAFYKECEGKDYNSERRYQVYKERWPVKEDLLAYLDWLMARLLESTGDGPLSTTFSPEINAEEIMILLANTNFANDNDYNTLSRALCARNVPIIPLGIDSDNIRYRIIPCNLHELFPDQKPPSVQGKLLYHILGVNTNVQPTQPATPYPPSVLGLPPKSTDLNELDDWRGGGFVFFHLGYIEIWTRDEKESQDPSPPAKDWYETNWNVVIKLDSDGTPGPVYIIYDMYPPNDSIVWREDMKIESDYWGHFPIRGRETRPQFSIAKIADDIRQLGAEYKLNPTEAVEHPVEVVHAVKTLRGTIVRTTVSRDSI